MRQRPTKGFPVFRKYAWDGPEIDVILETAREDNPERTLIELLGADPLLAAAARITVLRVDGAPDVSAWYEPAERPGLFLELANVELTRDGISAFVYRNGLLDISTSEQVEGPSMAWSQSRDNFSDVAEQVATMRSALANYLWIRSTDEHGRSSTLQRRRFAEEVSERLRGGMRLDEHLRFVPRHERLIDAIWIQFAQALGSSPRIHSCDRCLKFFQVADKAARTEKNYCGNTCKVAAYRERKRKAAILRQAGATLRQISLEIGSDVETIKGWLRTKGEK